MRFKLILLGILFLGAFLRLYHSNYYFPFGSDQESDLYAIKNIYDSIKKFEFKNLSLRGQLGTYLPKNTELLKDESKVPVYSGVFYYYFLLPWGIVSKFHPYGTATLFIFLGVICVYLIFDVGRKLFDDYTALLAAFFFSFSYWTISFSRTIWNASLVPFFVLLGLFAFVRILKGKIKFWPLLAFSVSAASQTHNSGYFFLIFMIVASIRYKLHLPSKKSYLGLTLLSFSLPLIPTLITEISTGFGNFLGMGEGLLKQLTLRYGASLGILDLTRIVFKEFALFLASGLGLAHGQIIDPLPESFDYLFITLGLILASVGLFMFSKKSFFLNLFKIKKSGAFLIFLWFLFFLPIPAIASIYYHEGLIHGHSMMGLLMGLPFFYLATAWFIRRLLLVNYLRIVALLILGLFLVTNSITVSNLIFRNRRSHYVRFDYGDKLEVMKFINTDSGDNPYLLNFLETEGSSFFMSAGSKHGFSYIAKIEELTLPGNIGERYVPPEEFLEINKTSRELPIYTVSEREYEEGSEEDTNGTLVEEIGLYNIYKK